MTGKEGGSHHQGVAGDVALSFLGYLHNCLVVREEVCLFLTRAIQQSQLYGFGISAAWP